MDSAGQSPITKLAFLVGTAILLCCGGDPPPVPKPRVNYAELPPGDHVLAMPLDAPESLLGYAVTFKPNGGIEIADKIDPRCEVFPKSSRDRWSDTLHQGTYYIAGRSTELARVFALTEAGTSARMTLNIANQTRITAELRGRCGRHVVTGVKVGTGNRAIRYKLNTNSTFIDDTKSALTWREPRAWAVTISTDVSQSELYINMPERIVVREPFSPRITTSRRNLWIIVLSCDADDMCWILRPSPEIPETVLEARQTTSLSPLAAGVPAFEQVIAYGFSEESDYRKYAPKGDDMTEEECTIYANRLYARLKDGEIPKERWARAVFRYEIVASSD